MSRNQEIMKIDIERQIRIEIRLRFYETIDIHTLNEMIKNITTNIHK